MSDSFTAPAGIVNVRTPLRRGLGGGKAAICIAKRLDRKLMITLRTISNRFNAFQGINRSELGGAAGSPIRGKLIAPHVFSATFRKNIFTVSTTDNGFQSHRSSLLYFFNQS
jgi:hypothetical protein